MSNFNHYLRIALFSIFAVALISCAQPPESEISSDASAEISAIELNSRIGTSDVPYILDVRSADEFSDGHLAGAVNIAHAEFANSPEEALSALPADRNEEIVVYCASGKRAGIASDVISAAGYTNVRHLAGDFTAWHAAKLPVSANR